jgi:hypothetical protein
MNGKLSEDVCKTEPVPTLMNSKTCDLCAEYGNLGNVPPESWQNAFMVNLHEDPALIFGKHSGGPSTELNKPDALKNGLPGQCI